MTAEITLRDITRLNVALIEKDSIFKGVRGADYVTLFKARVHYAEQLAPGLMQPLIDAAAKYNGIKSIAAQDLIYKRSR